MQGYSHDQAAALVRGRGFEPHEPYPGAHACWACTCPAGHAVGVKLSKVLTGRGCPQCRANPPLTPERAVALMVEHGFTPLEPYPGSHEPWLCRCTAGHESTPRLHNVRRGSTCTKCASSRHWTEQEAAAAMLAAGLEPLEPYRDGRASWRCRCVARGHQVTVRLVSIRQGRRCPDCSPTRPPTQEQAAAVMRAAGLEPLGPYVRSGDPWPCRCITLGHHVSPTLSDVKAGIRCAACRGNVPMSEADAVAAMRAAGFTPLAPFVSGSRPWPARCVAAGHESTPRLANVLKGTGCLDCAGTRRYSDTDAIAAMRAAGFEPLTGYPGTDAPWPSRCRKAGHESTPRLNGVLRGRGCGDCANKGINYTEPTVLYAVSDDDIVKVGITNVRNEKGRLAKHRAQGLVLLVGRRLCETGTAARELEQAWCDYVDTVPQHAVVRDRLPDGYTEAVYAHAEALDLLNRLLRR